MSARDSIDSSFIERAYRTALRAADCVSRTPHGTCPKFKVMGEPATKWEIEQYRGMNLLNAFAVQPPMGGFPTHTVVTDLMTMQEIERAKGGEWPTISLDVSAYVFKPWYSGDQDIPQAMAEDH